MPPSNTTCTIIHFSGVTKTGVPIFLNADYARHTETGEGDAYDFRFTHTALMAVATDVEDAYDAGTQPGGQDIIWVPAHTAAGTPFRVQFVETKALGTAAAYLKVYLDRGTPPWPTGNL